jgi:hypothetical protein
MAVLNADLYAVVLFMAIATTIIAPPVVARQFASLTPDDSAEGVVELEEGYSSEFGDLPPRSAPPEDGEPEHVSLS